MTFRMIICFYIGGLSKVNLSKQNIKFQSLSKSYIIQIISCTMLKEIKPYVNLSKEEYYITIFIQIQYYLNYFMYNAKRKRVK